eukprot:TRINITY_DN24769_c0_g1_i1.p1 TRINITY_DN24769_c0_g1~~TRINITY_DN24769_c0_g1_i1.p1  ORF type:complete len:537 (+),score=87.69 TRINITY_DN24769_c0_g1_i1:98-1708(+)
MACIQLERGPPSDKINGYDVQAVHREEMAKVIVGRLGVYMDLKLHEYNQLLLVEMQNLLAGGGRGTPLRLPIESATQTENGFAVGPQVKLQTEVDRGSNPDALKANVEAEKERPPRRPSLVSIDGGEDEPEHAARREREDPKKINLVERVDMVLGVVISLNFLQMCVETQFDGMDIGVELKLHEESAPESAAKILLYLEMIFAAIYTLEVVVKLYLLKSAWALSWWNWFDFIIVTLTYVELAFANSMGAVLARTFRLGRLLRLTRLVQHIEFFEAFMLIIRSLRKSISSLIWSSTFMILCVLVCALATCQLVMPYLQDGSMKEERRREVYEKYGTFTRTTLTMFECTIGNWGPPAWLLTKNYSEIFIIYSVLYKLCMGYAVVNVINAVFLRQTMKCADAIDEFTLAQEAKKRQEYIKKLGLLFKEMDTSGDGLVDREEFHNLISQPKVIAWFNMLEISSKDSVGLFDCLAAGDGVMTMDEFIEGIKRLKGDATAVDAMTLLSGINRIDKHLESLERHLVPQDAKGRRLYAHDNVRT